MNEFKDDKVVAFAGHRYEWHCIGVENKLPKILEDLINKGYAYEGAKAMLDFAFDELCAQEVVATIRPENYASRKVAERIGMVNVGSYIKMYNGKEMPHLIYSKRKADKLCQLNSGEIDL